MARSTRMGREVVTLTLDVGQGHDLEEVRARALTAAPCGRTSSTRARSSRATCCSRAAAVPAGAAPTRDLRARMAAHRATAGRDCAHRGRRCVAHGSTDPALDAAIRAIDPRCRYLRRTRVGDERRRSATMRVTVVCRCRTSVADCQIDRTSGAGVVGCDQRAAAARDASASARPERVGDGRHCTSSAASPASVNGVPMALTELIECLSLIGGQHGVGRTAGLPGRVGALHDALRPRRAAASRASEAGGSRSGRRLPQAAPTVSTRAGRSDRHAPLVNHA